MAEAILDASAVLAFLGREPGKALVQRAMPRALLCAVNLTEIVAKLIQRSVPRDRAQEIVRGLPCAVVDFDADLAWRAGMLWDKTQSIGLSLGDRACLALAAREGLPALTADRRWARGELGVEVRLIRGETAEP